MHKACYLIFAFLIIKNGDVHSQELTSIFQAKQFVNDVGDSLNYRIYVPEQPDSTGTYPLVLFLHGAGERGTDNRAQLRYGVWRFVADSVQQEHPSIVIAPQTPKGTYWGKADWRGKSSKLNEDPAKPLILVMALLEKVRDQYPVDSARIYLTGLSMGGFGTWNLVTRHPNVFAAAVPVAGGGDVTKAPQLAGLPIWGFHGVLDTVVPPEQSRVMISAIREAGGNPGYTEYPDVGHNSWEYAYREPFLVDWLFRRKSDSLLL